VSHREEVDGARRAVMRVLAARSGVCEGLVYALRRQLHDGTSRELETPEFAPVRVFEASMPPMVPACEPRRTSSPVRLLARSDLIEIALSDGQWVRVGREVNLAALRRVLTALRS
jgi:hypothetical protein